MMVWRMGRNQDAPAVGDEVTLLVVVQHHSPPQLRVAGYVFCNQAVGKQRLAKREMTSHAE